MTDQGNMISVAEKMLAELSQVVHGIEQPKQIGDGARATLRALTLSAAHVDHVRAIGGSAETLREVVQGKMDDLVETLRMFRGSMPAADSNIAAVNDLIARLA